MFLFYSIFYQKHYKYQKIFYKAKKMFQELLKEKQSNIIYNDFFSEEMINLIRRIHKISSLQLNSIYIYPLIGKLRRYIFSRKIYRPEAPKERYQNLKIKKQNFTQKEDGTYDIHTHERISFNSGYQVSFEKKDDSYTSREYDQIAYIMSLMSDNKVYLGVYDSTPEMSFHFEDFELANVISIIFNQNSIWSWKDNDEIKNRYYKEKQKSLN